MGEPQIEITPLVGYRCWRLEPEREWGAGFYLSPTAIFKTELMEISRKLRDAWRNGGVVKKVCHLRSVEDHSLSSCSCGLYSFKEARELYPFHRDSASYADLVCGAIYLWGEVIEHQWGYRSQYARIKELYYPQKRHPFVVHPFVVQDDPIPPYVDINTLVRSTRYEDLVECLGKKYGVPVKPFPICPPYVPRAKVEYYLSLVGPTPKEPSL